MTIRILVSAMLVLFCWESSAAQGLNGIPLDSEIAIHFSESVANIEYAAEQLRPKAPSIVHAAPSASSGPLWYGRIGRRLPDDPIAYVRHDVPFAASYKNGMPISIWCDANLNGNLSDDQPLRLYHYPTPAGARAALVDLTWPARLGGEVIPIAWKLRVVLEPIAGSDSIPRYRLQKIYARTGDVTMDGTTHHAFLFDGNNDGLYTKDYGDGLFVDTDDNRQLVVDPTSIEFLPFSVPSQIGRTLFETARIDPKGSEVTLVPRSEQTEIKQASVGDPAPDFSFESLDGKRVQLSGYRGHPVIVYFWASWCGACEELAPTLRRMFDRLHPRGLEILGVSFDDDRARLLGFEARHSEPWPISYFGRGFWENPIARLYGVSSTGSAYLVDPEGKFAGLYYDIDDLERNVSALLASQPGGTGATRER